ncbi:MAG: hypothetical protein LBE36_11590 [Flavobacteriaceae bacterium]|jgi:hypothetical protein|nr:hypothetical protein [Flavobacteriaceae bacterium]
MIIEQTKKEIIFRFPADFKIDDMQDLADLFAYKEIAQKSKAKQKDIDALVKEIKKRTLGKDPTANWYMRVVVDTNIVFSALLNPEGKFSQIIFRPRNRFNFYTTNRLV